MGASRKALVLLALAAVAALAALHTGLLNGFSAGGTINEKATGTIVVYWFLASCAVWVAGLWRTARTEAVMTIAAAACALGAAEIIMRVSPAFAPIGLMRYHGLRSAELHHVLPADRTMYYRRPGRQSIVVKTNEDGLRSEYSRDAFRSYGVRMVTLGDSQTFGLGVTAQEAFPQVMERRLRQRLGRQDVAVLNGGQISYSPLLEWRSYGAKIRQYQPTLVLLMVDATDIGDDYAYAQESLNHDGISFPAGPVDDPYRYRGALWELAGPFLRYPLDLWRPAQDDYRYNAFEVTIDGRVERNRFFIYRHPLSRTRRFFDATWRNISSLAAELERDHVALVVAVAPRYHHWNPNECPRNWEQAEYSNAEPFQFEYQRFFEEMRPTAGFGLVDLLPAFQATREFPLVFDNDPHFNARGHDFLARTLTDYVIDHRK
jgi:hypothetical protein